MTILEILQNKRDELLKKGNPLEVDFTAAELNTIADINALRNLKLTLSFPKTYETSSDIFMCAMQIIRGDGLERVLEFCVLANPCLRPTVSAVFGKVFS